MIKFHTLQVSDIRRETPDCVSIAFDIPQELKSTFEFKQGQYLTLKVNVNGEELRRSYSICSPANSEEPMRIAVKKIEDGRASTYLNEKLEVGHDIEVMPPLGNFYTEMKSGQAKHYVAFAAGSGITPIMSLISTAINTEPDSKFTLFYGNRNKEGIIFKTQLEKLAQEHPDRLRVYHILSREGEPDNFYYGRIDSDKCRDIIEEFEGIREADEYFLCGPYDMIKTLENVLQQHGVNERKIHFELFTNEPPEEAKSEMVDAEEGKVDESANGHSPVDAKVMVILDGDEVEVDVPAGEKILDCVLDAGLDAPYACTGGSCCTCRAKALEGSVDMEVNYALTDDEVEEGYILTCQSRPTSNRVVVDYDAP